MDLSSQKLQVLILCTANSARSQMAEGLLRELAADRVDVYSAGAAPSRVNHFAIEAMRECGIDISGQTSDHLSIYLKKDFDYVITVCDNAAETCPLFPGRPVRIHWSFPIRRQLVANTTMCCARLSRCAMAWSIGSRNGSHRWDSMCLPNLGFRRLMDDQNPELPRRLKALSELISTVPVGAQY